MVGIIPACAGNTDSLLTHSLHARDHPRMRGEHPRKSLIVLDIRGSSPHARGTPTAKQAPPTPHRDHPRMRGEHRTMRSRLESVLGSSPHARGTPNQWSNPAAIIGIIPACAGNTNRIGRTYVNERDHPRMRGEHSHGSQSVKADKGSSPHARGTLTVTIRSGT